MQEARQKFAEVIDRARLMKEPTTITRHGVPVAVVVSVEEWEAFRDSLRASLRSARRAR